jgi:FixJ family two-component response regulator
MVSFSEKEIEIIQLICQEFTRNREKLFISSRTVDGYRVKILEKMNVKILSGYVYAIHDLFDPKL